MKCIIEDVDIVEKEDIFSEEILKICRFQKNRLNIIEKPITIIYIQAGPEFYKEKVM